MADRDYRCREYRRFNVGCLNGQGPLAVAQEVRLPDQARETDGFALEAWIGNFGGSNVHLFNESLDLATCQSRMEQGLIDFLMTLPSGGKSEIWLPGGIDVLTVFFEGVNNSGQTQVVTLRVIDR